MGISPYLDDISLLGTMAKFLKQLDIRDLVYGFNFVDRHKKLGTFKNDELGLVNLTFKKIYD